MKINKNTVVEMHYAVSTGDTLIDSSYDDEPLTIIHGTGYVIEGLEDALLDKQAGDKFEVTISPEKAYGERFDEYVQTLPRNLFDGVDDLSVGTQLRADTDDGEQTVIVVDIKDESVTVDGNHPLAGMELSFDVEIISVRAATDEEISHGHIHAEGGCGHHH